MKLMEKSLENLVKMERLKEDNNKLRGLIK